MHEALWVLIIVAGIVVAVFLADVLGILSLFWTHRNK
jgi:hypothetical protein